MLIHYMKFNPNKFSVQLISCSYGPSQTLSYPGLFGIIFEMYWGSLNYILYSVVNLS